MTRPRYLRWSPAPTGVPKHPYRDSVLVYGVFAVVVVVAAWATGGSVWRAAGIAAIVWAAASTWSVARWRRRLRQPTEKEER
jgi:hypothetical protein